MTIARPRDAEGGDGLQI